MDIHMVGNLEKYARAQVMMRTGHSHFGVWVWMTALTLEIEQVQGRGATRLVDIAAA